MPSSKSKSSQKQQSISFDDSSLKDIGAGSKGTFIDVNSANDAGVEINNEGVEPEIIARVVESLGIASVETARAVAGSNQAVVEIAKSATATQTEVGKLTNQLALPVSLVLVAGAGFIAFTRGRGGRR